MATYDGSNIFGGSVRVRMEQTESASQANEFFGVNGKQALFGGSRGRMFFIDGVLYGSTGSTLAAAIGLILSYDDGVGRVLVDSYGVSWPSVVFRKFTPSERVLPGYFLPYKAVFEGLL